MLLIDDIALQLIGALLTPSLSINATANAVNAATAIDGYLLNVGTPPAGFTNLYNLTGAALAQALLQLSG